MACPLVVGTFPFSIYVAGSGTAWLPVGTPQLVHGADKLDMVVTIKRATGDAEASAGVELFATRTNIASGDPTAATGSFTGTNGDTQHYTYDLSSNTTDFYVQPGVLAKLNTTTPGIVEGTITVILGSCGRLIGRRDIEAFPYEDNTRPWFYIIGGWNPPLNASKLRAVLIGTAFADLEWRFYGRVANDPDEPSALTALGTAWSGFSDGNDEVNTGEIDLTNPLSLGSNQLLQILLALRMESEEYGVADWPPDSCPVPLVYPDHTCRLPTRAEIDRARDVLGPPRQDFEVEDFACFPVKLFEDDAFPSDADLEFYYTAWALLLREIDLVTWALCVTESYSADIEVALTREVTDHLIGVRPVYLTFIEFFIDRATEQRASATGGAFTYDQYPSRCSSPSAPDGTVGVIMPAGHPTLQQMAEEYRDGGPSAFCAVAGVAGILLHEVIHIVADGRGGGHWDAPSDPQTRRCWDEMRMAESAFRWAMSKRYPCVSSQPCCEGPFDDPSRFLGPAIGSPWECA